MISMPSGRCRLAAMMMAYVAAIHASVVQAADTVQQKSSFAAASNVRQRRNLQGGQKNKNCPKQYSLYHCDDPDLTYDIPCNKDTCEWDLTALDPTAQPGSCSAISVTDPLKLDLSDVLRPCALWSLTYGEHKSAAPSEAGTSD
jgi:hypothetical protein